MSIDKLTVRFPTHDAPAVDNFSLNVDAGELVLLAGGTGCGKSTVLNTVSAVIPRVVHAESSGSVTVGGHNVQSLNYDDRARIAAHLFQNVETQLFTDRVLDEVLLPLEFGPELHDDPEQMAHRALARFGLAKRAEGHVSRLSSGLKQRLALAAMHPANKKLLLLDEPLAYLDQGSARELVDMLGELRDRGLAILVAEHREDLLAQTADRVVRMTEQATLAPARRTKSGSMKVLATIEGLHFSHPNRNVLSGVDLSLHQGEAVALIGDNGCGKTTLCLLLAGMLKPNRGSALLGEIPSARLPRKQRPKAVAVVLQNPDRQLFSHTVLSEAAGPWTDTIEAERLLEALGLARYAKRHPRSLSHGQKRRLTLAKALARRPKVLLVDEPSVGQDSNNLASMFAELDRYLAGGGSLLLATHDQRAVTFADRVYAFENGRIIEQPSQESP
ncbi:ABC transporter ATP-binding protein [Salidesulfovibrio brasiliensis]